MRLQPPADITQVKYNYNHFVYNIVAKKAAEEKNKVNEEGETNIYSRIYCKQPVLVTPA